MPIYEYVCRDCKKHFEVLTTSSGSGETVKCPECGSLDVTKTISATNFRMGSGRPFPAAPCPAVRQNQAFPEHRCMPARAAGQIFFALIGSFIFSACCAG